jgi:hypothetical protein
MSSNSSAPLPTTTASANSITRRALSTISREI